MGRATRHHPVLRVARVRWLAAATLAVEEPLEIKAVLGRNSGTGSVSASSSLAVELAVKAELGFVRGEP
jgi:hypothetical protein